MSIKTPSFWYRQDGTSPGLREALLTPVALVGWVAWLVPYWPPTLTVRIARPKLDAVAS